MLAGPECTSQAAVWNVHGYPALLDQARVAVAAASESLLIAVWPNEAAALRDDVATAHERGIDITTLCMAACETECGGCKGDVYRYRAGEHEFPRRLIVVPDGSEVVAGEVGADGDAQSVRSAQPLLVDICTSSIRSSIAIAAVIADLGKRLETTLAPSTRDVLAAADRARTGP